MKYDLPPELSAAAARDQPSMAGHLMAVKGDLPHWVARAVAQAVDSLDRARLTTREPALRAALGDVGSCLRAQRTMWVQQLVQSLARALDDDAAGPQAPDPASADAAMTLTLVDEDAVDEDIALSRLVQAAESDAEASLRELAARCSSMRGLASVSPDANPMRPTVVAGAVRRAVADFGLPGAQRVLLLRELGAAMGSQLVSVYAAQRDRLIEWGVEPARFTLRLSLGEAAPGRDAGACPVSLEPRASSPVAAMAADALQRLGVCDAAGAPDQAPDVMAQLVALLLSRAPVDDGMRALIRRLDGPARRMAAHDPQVWTSPDHPLWRLLDRVVAAGSAHDAAGVDGGHAADAATDRLGAALERAVQLLEATRQPDAAVCEAALTDVEFAITGLLDEQARRVAPQAEALHQHQVRADVEGRLREQIVQQVRGSGAPPSLRQFLVGPWAVALAHTATTLGADSEQMKVQAELVDDLIAACNRPVGARLSRSLFTRCITHVRLGLGDAAFPEARVQAELADLEQVLLGPWQAHVDGEPVHELSAAREADAGVPAAPVLPFSVTMPYAATAPFDSAAGLGLHEALPTVPIDMDNGDNGPHGDHMPDRSAAWLDSLEPGQFCRLFLLERWMNTHLVWRSAGRTMFVFSSRHAGRTHSLSRRSLQKLRAAGLATTLERGQHIAQAMQDLASQSAR